MQMDGRRRWNCATKCLARMQLASCRRQRWKARAREQRRQGRREGTAGRRARGQQAGRRKGGGGRTFCYGCGKRRGELTVHRYLYLGSADGSWRRALWVSLALAGAVADVTTHGVRRRVQRGLGTAGAGHGTRRACWQSAEREFGSVSVSVGVSGGGWTRHCWHVVHGASASWSINTHRDGGWRTADDGGLGAWGLGSLDARRSSGQWSVVSGQWPVVQCGQPVGVDWR